MRAGLPPAPVQERPYEIQWFGCDFMSGEIVAELPSLRPSGTLDRRLGEYTSASFDLALDGAPPNWRSATEPGRALIVGVWDGVPGWAGYVPPRTRGSSSTVNIAASTIEAYLDRRYTGTLVLAQTDEATIAASLFGVAQAGLGCLDVDAPATGTVRDRSYADSDDKTIYSALTELMGVQGGPEWSIDPVWNTSRSGFRLVARVRKRIGVQDAAPQAVFGMPGTVTEYESVESWEDGKGANVILATGAGEGDTGRATSAVHRSPLVDQGWPVYEYRWSPSSSITSRSVLDEHADQGLTELAAGTTSWKLTARASRAPHLGSDWSLGDNVRLTVARDTSPGHPEGVDVVARAVGWSLDPAADTISPVLREGG
ncbi:hypothetical protein ABZ330_21845 [Streptomyces sp. NPDC006172]|uniref:hypothetical protein n=1 Tax=Streptomyces sp. NPDC006172 TaxID=3154470 RepID=UPI0033F93DF1